MTTTNQLLLKIIIKTYQKSPKHSPVVELSRQSGSLHLCAKSVKVRTVEMNGSQRVTAVVLLNDVRECSGSRKTSVTYNTDNAYFKTEMYEKREILPYLPSSRGKSLCAPYISKVFFILSSGCLTGSWSVFCIWVLIGDEFVLLYRSSLDILFGQNMLQVLRRHLVWNTSSLFISSLETLQL